MFFFFFLTEMAGNKGNMHFRPLRLAISTMHVYILHVTHPETQG